MLLIHQAINAIGELVLALTIPFLWWLIVTRRQVRFDRWLGFFLPPVQRTWLTTVIVVLFTLLLAIPLPLIVDHGILATFVFNHRGFAGIPAALVYAIVGTSCPRRSFSGASYSSASRTASAFCPPTSPRQFALGRSTASCWRALGTGWSP